MEYQRENRMKTVFQILSIQMDRRLPGVDICLMMECQSPPCAVWWRIREGIESDVMNFIACSSTSLKASGCPDQKPNMTRSMPELQIN